MSYLGRIIFAAGCTEDPKNIIAASSKLRKKPAPISKLRSVLGLVGYFRSSSPNVSQTAHPLFQLLKKNHSAHKLGKEPIECQGIHQAALA